MMPIFLTTIATLGSTLRKAALALFSFVGGQIAGPLRYRPCADPGRNGGKNTCRIILDAGRARQRSAGSAHREPAGNGIHVHVISTECGHRHATALRASPPSSTSGSRTAGFANLKRLRPYFRAATCESAESTVVSMATRVDKSSATGT